MAGARSRSPSRHDGAGPGESHVWGRHATFAGCLATFASRPAARAGRGGCALEPAAAVARLNRPIFLAVVTAGEMGLRPAGPA
jgi:hypothetical protein